MFPGNYKARYLEDGKDVSIPDDFYSSDFYTDRLLGYLERDRQPGKPFFAYLAFTAPHWPLQAPDQYLDRYRGNYADGYEALRRKRLARMIELGILPAGTRPNDPLADKLPTWEQLTEAQRREQTRIMQIYAAMVDNMDYNIGRVLDHLRKSGELDNTFVLFMSDNGPESASPESLGTTEDRNGIRDWVDATFDNSPRNMGRKGSYVTLGPAGRRSALRRSRTSRASPRKAESRCRRSCAIRGDLEGRDQRRSAAREGFRADHPRPGRRELSGAVPGECPVAATGTLDASRPAGPGAAGTGARLGVQRSPRTVQRAMGGADASCAYGNGRWELYDLARDPAFSHDLAASEPGKVAELAADWNDYAGDNGVVPAPIRYKYGQMTCLYSHCIQ
ncbi:sulfatase-like hydrolase/transferase [Pseudomonas aeruginosa]|nr:sulfatase-like hydrolase/transferase [Pseudomonas aeruginosa]